MNYRKYRLAANMTQSELAERVGTSKAHISQIETGSREPSVKLLAHISIVLDVCLNELVGIPCNKMQKHGCYLLFSTISYEFYTSNLIHLLEEI